mgnify:CR=1 FL=1
MPKKVTTRNKRTTSVQSETGFTNPGLGITEFKPQPKASFLSARNYVAIDSSESIKEYFEQPDFECREIDAKASIKTNFYILNNNWLALVKFLKNLREVVKYVWEHIQLDAMVDAVIERLEKRKNVILVPYNTIVDNIGFQTVVNGKTYKVRRESDHCIIIEREKDWATENLMVFVKDNNYTSVNVAITTANNQIRLDFLDGIANNPTLSSNFYVFFV